LMTSPLMMKIFPEIPDGVDSPKLTLTNPSGSDLPVTEELLLKLMDIVEVNEKVIFNEIEAVYVDENEIVNINREYLKHDYVTDIITFRYDEQNRNAIEGTLYCCAPRITEQSDEFESDEKSEFLRVFVHGLLHLSGYDDKTDEEKKMMTALENKYLEQLSHEL
jgi:probable rRNA maturation factor